MEDLKVEARISYKNRLCWVLVFIGAIIIGLLFFTLRASFNVSALFSIIFVVSLMLTFLGELATKTVFIFWRRSLLVFPLGSVVNYLVNYVSQKYYYTTDDPYGFIFTVTLSLLLFALCGLGSIIGTMITRLTSGYEALCETPVVLSYSVKSTIEKMTDSLKNFLKSLNVEYTTTIRKNQQFFEFFHNHNQYFLFPYSIDSDQVELDLIVIRWRQETIVKPEGEDLETFSDYLQSYLNRQKKENKLGEWTSKFKPVNAETSRNQVWSSLTSAFNVKERLTLRGVLTQRIVSILKAHKTRIVDVAVAVVVIIVGDFILRYVLHWIG